MNNVVVILTDGGERNRAGATAAARRLSGSGVGVYVVAYGGHTNMAEVARLATSPALSEGYLYRYSDVEGAATNANSLLRAMCARLR